MSVADLSVMISALQQPEIEDVRLMTVIGSDNDRLWSLMAEKGWLDRLDEPSTSPVPLVKFSVRKEFADHVAAVAVYSFEGRRRGMSGEEILASAKGPTDPRLAHLHS